MTLADVNILIYAFRADSKEHGRYKTWLEGTLNGPGAYAVSTQILASFVRIVTHPKIFRQPSELDEAFAFANALLLQPNVSIVEPGERHFALYQELCSTTRARGNFTQDAWLAALAIESGCEWVSADQDYARFPGLRWQLL